MQLEDFNKIIDEQIGICSDMLVRKGGEYAPDKTADRLGAFKKAAVITNSTPKQALLGMLAKHLVSVSDMCVNGKYSKALWSEKITDSINYLLILRAMIEEEQENEKY